jgi:hypothetical protein
LGWVVGFMGFVEVCIFLASAIVTFGTMIMQLLDFLHTPVVFKNLLDSYQVRMESNNTVAIVI